MITFMYPSLNREDQNSSPFTVPAPDILIPVTELGKVHTFSITAGVCMVEKKNYIMSVDAFIDGESVLVENDNAPNFSESIFYSTHPIGNRTFINVLPNLQIKIEKSGAYDVVLSLYESSDVSNLGNVVAKKTCQFIVVTNSGI